LARPGRAGPDRLDLGLALPHLLALAARVLQRRAALVHPAHRLADGGLLRAQGRLGLDDLAA
jgi:hypothetical protein